MKKKEYIRPTSEEVNIELTTMLAMSGWGEDSDDSEFSAPAQRRGTWGNLWAEELNCKLKLLNLRRS